MKSLEEVIKYKLNFLPKGTEPFYAIQTYRARRGTDPPPTFYNIYKPKNPIFSNDSFSFMEDITPLFIYISSCEKYYRENGHGKIDTITIKIIMEDYEVLDFGFSDTHDGPSIDFREHRISEFKKYRSEFFERVGYCMRFTKPFGVEFVGGFNHFLTEEEELQYEAELREYEEAYYRQEAYYTEQGYYAQGGAFIGENDDESEEEDDTEEELPINDFKTFKSDQCVICLEKKPKVLFCNCGHICICEKCATHRHDNCPVCKKKNTILRIIE